MNMQRPKMRPELLLLLDTDILEVLVAEYHHATLGDEQRELVFLCVTELGEL